MAKSFALSDYVVPRHFWPKLRDVNPEMIDDAHIPTDSTIRSDGFSACRTLAHGLINDGLVVVKGEDMVQGASAAFQAGMAEYFARSYHEKHHDEDLVNHQGGWTPGAPYAGAEVARNHRQYFKSLFADHQLPFTFHLPLAEPDNSVQLPDLKERVFWRLRAEDLPRPEDTAWYPYNKPRYVPDGLQHLVPIMETTMASMLKVARKFARMLAVGLGLPEQVLTTLMEKAPHLLAPTGADLAHYSTPGTVLGLAHYDFNLFTLHLRSNCPGLIAWTSRGVPFLVRVPEGYALLQAGRALERLTGGKIRAGFHEVVRVPEADTFVEQARAANRSAVRTTTTLFVHGASDLPLQVLTKFRTPKKVAAYPDTTFGAYMEEELVALGLQPVSRVP